MAQSGGPAMFVFDDGSKENSKPLKSGRAPGSTFGEKRTVFGSNAAVEKARAEKRAEHLRTIEATASSEKPLAAWLDYIRWIQAEYPTGGLESDLLASLERVTRLYANDARFKNEPDYVKLWVSYADLLADPGDCFRYMRERGIGATVSLFYIAWAWLAEHRGDFSSAEQIYSLGIGLGATPLDRLKLRYREFQRRMYKKWLATQTNNSNSNNKSVVGGTGAPAANAGSAAPQPTLSVAQLASLSTATGPSTITGGRVTGSAAPTTTDENGRSAMGAAPSRAAALPSATAGLGYDHLTGLSAPTARAPLGQVSEAGAGLSYRPPMVTTEAGAEDGFGNGNGGATEMRNGVVQMRRQPQPSTTQTQGQGQAQGRAAGSSSSSAPSSSSSSGPGFAVFEEEPASSAPSGGLVMGHSSSSSSSSSNLWAHLPTEKERKKENTQAPLKWTDPAAVLPARPGSSSSSSSSSASADGGRETKESNFLVYEEDNDEPAPQPARASAAPAKAAVGKSSAVPAAAAPAAVPMMNPRLLEAAPAPAPVAVAAPPAPQQPQQQQQSSSFGNESTSYEEERAALWFSRNPAAKVDVEAFCRRIEEEAAVARAKAKQQQHRAALAGRGGATHGNTTSSSSMMMMTTATATASMSIEQEAAPQSPIIAAPPVSSASNAAAAAAAKAGLTFGIQGMSPIASLGDDATAGGQTMRMRMMMTAQHQLPHTIQPGIGVVAGPGGMPLVSHHHHAAIIASTAPAAAFVPFADDEEGNDDVTRASQSSVVSDFGEKEEVGGIAPYLLAPPRHQKQQQQQQQQQQQHQHLTARLSSVEELKFLLDEAEEAASVPVSKPAAPAFTAYSSPPPAAVRPVVRSVPAPAPAPMPMPMAVPAPVSAAAEAADRDDQTLHSRLADQEMAELFSSPSLPAGAMASKSNPRTGGGVKAKPRPVATTAVHMPAVAAPLLPSSENGPLPSAASSSVAAAAVAPLMPRGAVLSALPSASASSGAPVPATAVAAVLQSRVGPAAPTGRLPPPGARRLSAAVLKRAGSSNSAAFEVFSDA